MKLSYSKLIELFEQENIPDIIGYIDDFSMLANSLIKKGEFDKLDKILKLSLQYEVLDNHIPYYQLFEAINSLNTIESETAYNELVQYFIRNKDERLYSLLLEHINLALFKYSDFENASKYIKIYLEHFPNDYVCGSDCAYDIRRFDLSCKSNSYGTGTCAYCGRTWRKMGRNE